jgi:hypothetical protein
MQKKFINRWYLMCSVGLLSALALFAVSCDDSDPEPLVHGANFETAVATTGDGKKIIFMNTSANAESAIWLFGDGQTSDELAPTHAYAEQGTYTVELISVGVAGSIPPVSQKSLVLVVTQPPIATCDVKATASNFIKNGEFETAASWTVNSLSAAGLVNAVYGFGSTVNTPCPSTGKAFRINNLVPFENNGNLIWQSLGVLPVGKYRFSGDVNIQTGESQDLASTTAGKNYFVECFLTETAPEDTKSLNASKEKPNVISGFNAWWGGATNDIPAGAGSFPVIAFPFEDVTTLKADNRGDFVITEAKEYFFAIQFGTYGGSYGAGGITIDNFAIVKIVE